MTWVTNNMFANKMAAAIQYANNWLQSQSTANSKIAVYKGTMPSYTTTRTLLLANYPSDLLCLFSTFSLTRSNATVYMSQNPTPSDVTATGTGTATWFAMYNMGTGNESVLFGDVSVNGGTGALYLNTTNIVTGNTISFLNFSFTCLGVV